jgi:hypothetical protein
MNILNIRIRIRKYLQAVNTEAIGNKQRVIGLGGKRYGLGECFANRTFVY